MRKWLGLVAAATAAQAAGRVVNFAVPFVVLSLHPPGAQTDALLLLLAVSFYFYGTLANSLTDATVPLYAQEQAGPSSRMQLTCALLAGCSVGIGWMVAAGGTPASRLVFAVAAGTIVASGLLAAFPVAHLQLMHRFGLPGLTWLCRLVPLAVYAGLSPPTHSLHWLAAGIALADCTRLALLRAAAAYGTDRASPDAARVDGGLARHYYGMLLATMISGLNPLVDRAIASLGSAGSISLLDLAERLFSVVGTLCSVGVSSVTLVYLSRNREIAADPTRWWRLIRLTVTWSLAWTAAGAVAGEIGIPFLSLHWFRTTAHEMEALLWSYRAFLVGLPPLLLGTVCVRELISRRQLAVLAQLAGLSVVLNAVISLALFRLAGVPGIAFATSVVYFLTALPLVWLTRPHRPVRAVTDPAALGDRD